MSSGSLPFGTYHRTAALGSGSFGAVVTVYNDDGEEFAMKLFERDDGGDEEDGEYQVPKPVDLGALREISCLRLFRGENRHENIIELHDVQTDWTQEIESTGAGTSGCLSIALPLGKGGSLASAIQRGTVQGFPKQAKVTLAHGILSAVAFLHDNGIIHRDIKSDNVLIEYDMDAGTWKSILIDFSLAKPIRATMWGGKRCDANALDVEAVAHTGEVSIG
jgi:serine/threonine protein kinase